MDLVIGCNNFHDGQDDAWAKTVQGITGVESVSYQTARKNYNSKSKFRTGFNDQVVYDYDRCFIHLRNEKGHCNREQYGVIQRFVKAKRSIFVLFEDRGQITVRYFNSIRTCDIPHYAMWAVVNYGEEVPVRYLADGKK